MSSPRILILRTSALGDIVHALPVLSRLRSEFPAATIGWVVERAFAPLLSGHPGIDEIITADLRPWRHALHRPGTWRQIGLFIRRLQGFSAEVVLDLMGNHKAGALAAWTLADRRIGLAAPFRREPSSAVWISEPVAARGHHSVDRMLSVLAGLGLDPGPADFGSDGLRETPPEEELEESEFVLIHPTAAWANKSYPPASWGLVARRLANELECPVLVAPGPGERRVAAAVSDAAASPRVRELAPMTLPALVYLQRRARLVLAGDTGPLHLAHALGRPVVCIIGPTDPVLHGPYLAPHLTVWHELPCSCCHKKLDGPRACLVAIDPGSIVAKARSVLESGVH